MYFKQIDEIVLGLKTQTRRVCKPNEAAFYDGYVRNIESVFSRGVQKLPSIGAEIERYRLKWQVGRDYAVSPGRGKPGVWWNELLDGTREWQQNRPGEFNNWQPLRIRIAEIRREKLQDISAADAIAEGYPHTMPQRGVTILPPVSWYAELWTAINGKGSWKANPDVWVLTFEVVRDA